MVKQDAFVQQLEAMYARLGKLYENVNGSPNTQQTEMFPHALKELGLAAEELQVASEEMHQQNEEMVYALNSLTEKKQYYQQLFDQSPEASLITTLDGKIQDANLAAARLLNLSQLFLAGKLLVTFVPLEWRASFRSELNRLNQSSHPKTWSASIQPRDGDPVDLSITTAPICNSNGTAIGLYWTMREMTDSWATIAASSKTTLLETTDPQTATAERTLYTYSKGEVVPLTHQAIWQVQQGLVKLITLTENNEDVLLGLIGPSGMFGAGSSFLPTYQATALTDVQLVRFSAVEVKSSSHLTQTLMLQLTQRLLQMESLLAISGQRRVKDRLHHFLRLLKREIGEPIDGGIRLSVRLTHEDLASACCTTRVTVTRLLSELQQQKKVLIDSKSHIVLNESF